jgi:hypothetical protein
MPTQLPTFTHAPSKAAFVHVTDVILDKSNITAAFKEGGIEDVSSILQLTDVTVDNLTFLDPYPNVIMAYHLKMGEIGLIPSTMFTIAKKLMIPLIISGLASPRMNLNIFVVILITPDILVHCQISIL